MSATRKFRLARTAFLLVLLLTILFFGAAAVETYQPAHRIILFVLETLNDARSAVLGFFGA